MNSPGDIYEEEAHWSEADYRRFAAVHTGSTPLTAPARRHLVALGANFTLRNAYSKSRIEETLVGDLEPTGGGRAEPYVQATVVRKLDDLKDLSVYKRPPRAVGYQPQKISRRRRLVSTAAAALPAAAGAADAADVAAAVAQLYQQHDAAEASRAR